MSLKIDEPKIVFDGIHGDIIPSKEEWGIIGTPTFQRLRKLKQLQLAYYVYPNATHTRLAHSLGVLHITSTILDRIDLIAGQQKIEKVERDNLRLAALLHDIGHYPYSHLLEQVDTVKFTEAYYDDALSAIHTNNGGAQSSTQIDADDSVVEYPSHEELGGIILTKRSDIREKLGGAERAATVARYFKGEEIFDIQTTKIVHSNLDADRLDYLLRDGQATGVPYGKVDLHFLLNHIRKDSKGRIAISMKALPAAEHFLLARAFLTRTVCQHKTVFGFEEAARQLLRRLKIRAQESRKGSYGVPANRNEIIDIVNGASFEDFADSWVDTIFSKACEDKDVAIRSLAMCITKRIPPVLLWERQLFHQVKDERREADWFETKTRQLEHVIKKFKLSPVNILVARLKPVGFQKYGARLTFEQAEEAKEEEPKSEMIRVLNDQNDSEPIVNLEQSLLHQIGDYLYCTHRVYLVQPEQRLDQEIIDAIKHDVKAVYDRK